MLKLLVTIHAIAHRLPARLHRQASERGSVTIEHVLWAVAAIGFVGLVAAAVKAYVTAQAGNIK
ncbi:hypothetical protein KVF89_25280 [Nocardioides carbamazepini]|uniref:hypothetical protein n=1 Tax=Nocardioides carbamazepini TaxID=2854259 RepID=UPI002149F3E7|nr:hypothetical protein [Nocardioides carbamazepini]MCR1785873.1 hypothetical protein [Nocardioides carbamazepini]